MIWIVIFAFGSDDIFVDVVSFVGADNRIEITYSTAECELTCQFLSVDNRSFTLQDGLLYAAITKYKGLYQIARKENLEMGIAYLAEAVKCLFEVIDLSDPMNFQKVYQYSVDTHKKLLDDYYLKTDINKAEDNWKKKEYDKAKELLEKHIDFLSTSQRKKLEYIKKLQ